MASTDAGLIPKLSCAVLSHLRLAVLERLQKLSPQHRPASETSLQNFVAKVGAGGAKAFVIDPVALLDQLRASGELPLSSTSIQAVTELLMPFQREVVLPCSDCQLAVARIIRRLDELELDRLPASNLAQWLLSCCFTRIPVRAAAVTQALLDSGYVKKDDMGRLLYSFDSFQNAKDLLELQVPQTILQSKTALFEQACKRVRTAMQDAAKAERQAKHVTFDQSDRLLADCWPSNDLKQKACCLPQLNGSDVPSKVSSRSSTEQRNTSSMPRWVLKKQELISAKASDDRLRRDDARKRQVERGRDRDFKGNERS